MKTLVLGLPRESYYMENLEQEKLFLPRLWLTQHLRLSCVLLVVNSFKSTLGMVPN
uniref:Uncharacterized protein n=1 Tax=Zea mays TaxID=4577 RepID=C4J331_MAIZE|nr:unknown [Zea mays]